jgi:hypothetical protein
MVFWREQVGHGYGKSGTEGLSFLRDRPFQRASYLGRDGSGVGIHSTSRTEVEVAALKPTIPEQGAGVEGVPARRQDLQPAARLGSGSSWRRAESRLFLSRVRENIVAAPRLH